MKKTNLLIILLFVLPLQLIAQVVGENKSFRAQYNMVGRENIRYRTFNSIPVEVKVIYNKEDQCITIFMEDKKPSLHLVRYFRQEYAGGKLMNCMNVVELNDSGIEEVVGCVFWDEYKFLSYSLGRNNDKIFVFYNRHYID